jgi:drug/metabolite transporter (DMT)-like permease
MPTAALVAVGVAILYALADTSVKRALSLTSPITTAQILIAVQWLLFSALLLRVDEFPEIDAIGLICFIGSGLLTPVLFVTFFFVGIERVGVSRASTLKASAPVYAVIVAVAFLGERPTLLEYVGIVLILSGILSLLGEKRTPSQDRQTPKREANVESRTRVTRRMGILFSLLAGVCTGLSAVIIKVALEYIPFPLFGAWMGTSVALVALPLISLLFPKGERYRVGLAAWPWLILAGLFSAGAVYYRFVAIGLGEVSIVIALIQTSPLFVVLFSIIFLRRLEQVTGRVAFGAILTVAGGVLVSLY